MEFDRSEGGRNCSTADNRPDLFVTTRRPDRPVLGPTSGSLQKRVKGLNRPGSVSRSRPDWFDRPARSGFKNVDTKTRPYPS
ncbi:hypothetical protein Hanom_Chr04g00302111 [Helianthus anomalus]